MKTLTVLAIALTLTIETFGHTSKDYQTTTKEQTITVIQNGELIAKKVKVVLTKEQNIEFNAFQIHRTNQDRKASPVKVTKLILVGDANSDIYNEALEIEYFTAPRISIDYNHDDYEVESYFENGLLNTKTLETSKVKRNKVIHGILKITGNIQLDDFNQLDLEKKTS
jgi:hypothetical protein